MHGEILNRRLLFFKAGLLLALGILASTLLILSHPDLLTMALLIIAIWGFCRAYFFAFYVIQHYVDPQFRFAGLVSILRYLYARHKKVE